MTRYDQLHPVVTIKIIIVEVLDSDQCDHMILGHYQVASLIHSDFGQVG